MNRKCEKKRIVNVSINSIIILHLTVVPVAAAPTAPRRLSGSGRISISRGAPAGDQSERSI